MELRNAIVTFSMSVACATLFYIVFDKTKAQEPAGQEQILLEDRLARQELELLAQEADLVTLTNRDLIRLHEDAIIYDQLRLESGLDLNGDANTSALNSIDSRRSEELDRQLLEGLEADGKASQLSLQSATAEPNVPNSNELREQLLARASRELIQYEQSILSRASSDQFGQALYPKVVIIDEVKSIILSDEVDRQTRASDISYLYGLNDMRRILGPDVTAQEFADQLRLSEIRMLNQASNNGIDMHTVDPIFIAGQMLNLLRTEGLNCAPKQVPCIPPGTNWNLIAPLFKFAIDVSERQKRLTYNFINNAVNFGEAEQECAASQRDFRVGLEKKLDDLDVNFSLLSEEERKQLRKSAMRFDSDCLTSVEDAIRNHLAIWGLSDGQIEDIISKSLSRIVVLTDERNSYTSYPIPFCGGILINASTVLTARHCFFHTSATAEKAGSSTRRGQIIQSRLSSQSVLNLRIYPLKDLNNPESRHSYRVLSVTAPSQNQLESQFVKIPGGYTPGDSVPMEIQDDFVFVTIERAIANDEIADRVTIDFIDNPELHIPSLLLGYYYFHNADVAFSNNPVEELQQWHRGFRGTANQTCVIVDKSDACYAHACQALPFFSGGPLLSINPNGPGGMVQIGILGVHVAGSKSIGQNDYQCGVFQTTGREGQSFNRRLSGPGEPYHGGIAVRSDQISPFSP